MKKIIAMLCAFVLAFCITACKKGKTDNSESSSLPVISSQNSETAGNESGSESTVSSNSEQTVKQNKAKPSQSKVISDEVNLDGNDSVPSESGSKTEDSPSSDTPSESDYYKEWR